MEQSVEKEETDYKWHEQLAFPVKLLEQGNYVTLAVFGGALSRLRFRMDSRGQSLKVRGALQKLFAIVWQEIMTYYLRDGSDLEREKWEQYVRVKLHRVVKLLM